MKRKLLRVVITFDAKKPMDVGRQTNFIEEEDLLSESETIVIPSGKKVKNIKIKFIEVNSEREKRDKI